PLVTVIGLRLGLLVGGAVITETVFAVPGLGRMIVQAVNQRDFPIVQGGVLLIAVAVIVINFAVDLMYLFLDPRIRYA
ncbi:MAG: ABC transporter permease subunit, partial [bacterium]